MQLPCIGDRAVCSICTRSLIPPAVVQLTCLFTERYTFDKLDPVVSVVSVCRLALCEDVGAFHSGAGFSN